MPPYLQHVVYRKATECRFCVRSPFACISTLTSNSLESIPQRMPITGPGPHSLHVVTMTPLDTKVANALLGAVTAAALASELASRDASISGLQASVRPAVYRRHFLGGGL